AGDYLFGPSKTATIKHKKPKNLRKLFCAFLRLSFDTRTSLSIPFRTLHMTAHADSIVTAGLRPDLFAGRGILTNSRTLVFAAVIVLIVAGFGFRVPGLSAEGLSEDELNKLNAVADYRAHGLTGANGEHP